MVSDSDDPAAALPRAGDPRERAIPALVERHGARLHALGLRFCGDATQAEDLVQETFLQAWRAWDDFEGRSDPATWLYTIASRACRRFHRKRAGEPDALGSLDEETGFGATQAALVPTPEPGPLEAELRREGKERLGAAITTLPLDFRMPLVLKEVVGFRVAQVAEVLGLEEATVKTRLHRARLRLKQALDEVLPRRALPSAAYSLRVCLDLLQAEQEAMDRDVPFPVGDEVVCERCQAVFRTMDFASDICRDLGSGALPPDLRRRLAEEFGREAPDS